MMYHQWDHYRALETDPMYLAEFLVDVRMEELSAYMPRTLEPVEVVATLQESWSKNQWDTVDQLRCQVAHLHKKFLTLEELLTTKGHKPRYK